MILVTGGLGYIGSHTVVELLSRGYEVIILDNFSNSHPGVGSKIQTISGVKPLIFEGDIRDVRLLNKIFSDNKISGVIHFAGLKSVSESIRNPLEYYSNNVAGTLNLIECVLRYRINNFIFSSSATVYGSPEKSHWTRAVILVEQLTHMGPLNILLNEFSRIYLKHIKN